MVRRHLLRSLYFFVAYSAAVMALTCASVYGSTPILRAQNLKMQTDIPVAVLHHVRQLIAGDKLEEARAEVMQALKSFPRQAELLNFLGIIEAEEYHSAAAESDFQESIREAPHYSGAYLNLAHLYQDEIGRNRDAIVKAISTYQQLLNFDRHNGEANYQLALLQTERRAFEDSIRHLAAMPLKERFSARSLALQCADHAGLGNTEQAKSLARQLLRNADLTEADVLTILPVLARTHHPKLTRLLLEGLEERNLASPQSLTQLATLQEQTGHLTQARGTLEKVAAKQPTSVIPLLELAHVANQQRDFRGALGYLAHARDLEPQNAGIHFFFGMVCVELELHQDAYVSLKRAVQLSPNNPYYNYALGAVCTDRENAHEAIRYFKKYCVLEPRDPRGKLALAGAYYYSHNLDSAHRILDTIVGNSVTAAGADYYLGRIAKDQGQWAAASLDFHRAIDQAPTFAAAYAALGSVYLSEKKYAESDQALRRAIQLEPNNYLANFELMVLYQRTKSKLAAAQARKFAQVNKERQQRAALFLRTIRVAPEAETK